MSTGMLRTDKVTEHDKKVVDQEFVTVSIKDKDGHSWEATGNAAMVVIIKGDHSEVDAVGGAQDLSRLLATAMIKVRELVAGSIVADAIGKYLAHIQHRNPYMEEMKELREKTWGKDEDEKQS